MWWRNALVILAVAALAGCGFRPLYGKSSGDPHIASDMSSIYVTPIADRQGQLLRNALLSQLDSQGHARYRLEVKLVESENSVLLQEDETAAIDDLSYDAQFTLFEGDVPLTKGDVTRSYSFDFLNQQYSNISARGFIQRRAADEIAVQIRDTLAAYFVRATAARKAAGVQAPAATPASGTPQ